LLQLFELKLQDSGPRRIDQIRFDLEPGVPFIDGRAPMHDYLVSNAWVERLA
jgi:hypothetical protein